MSYVTVLFILYNMTIAIGTCRFVDPDCFLKKNKDDGLNPPQEELMDSGKEKLFDEMVGRLAIDVSSTSVKTFANSKEFRWMIDNSYKYTTYIVDNSYNAQFGARPLKHYMQKTVESLVAKEILQNKIKDGDTVEIFANADGLFIKQV